MRKLLLIALLALTPSLASASTQVFVGRQPSGTTAAKFMPLNAIDNNASTPTNGSTAGVLPTAGTFSNLHVWTDVAPGAGTTWTFNLYNGSDSVVTCAISGAAATSCSDTTHSVSAAAGDFVAVHASKTGSPVSTTMYYSVQFTPTTANQTAILSYLGGSLSSTTVQYARLSGNSTPNTTETNVQNLFPNAGTLSNFYENSSTAVFNPSGSYAFTVRDNVSGTSLTCTATGASSCQDTTHSASVTGGDEVDIQSSPSTPWKTLAAGFGAVFTPSTSGNFTFLEAWSGNDNGASARYLPPVVNTTGSSISTIEASSSVQFDAMTISKLAIAINTAPGVGKTRVFTIDQNNTPTSATCTISDTNTSCTWSGSLTVALGDLIDISDVPSGSATITTGSATIVASVSSPAPSPAPAPIGYWEAFLQLFAGIF